MYGFPEFYFLRRLQLYVDTFTICELRLFYRYKSTEPPSPRRHRSRRFSHRFRFNPTYQRCPHNTYPVLADTLASSETDSELVKSNARDSNDKQCFPISARIKRLPVVPRRRHADDIPFRLKYVRMRFINDSPLFQHFRMANYPTTTTTTRKRERERETLKQNLNIEMSTYQSDYHIESYRSLFLFNNLNDHLSFPRNRINYINVITCPILL